MLTNIHTTIKAAVLGGVTTSNPSSKISHKISSKVAARNYGFTPFFFGNFDYNACLDVCQIKEKMWDQIHGSY